MPSILVVEDNAAIRESLGELLSAEGYGVELAPDGRAACDVLAQGSAPCTILLDLMMPVMDGWEFLEWKARSDYRDVPVVVLTALDVAGDVEGLAGRYGCEVVSKTGAVPDLLRRVARRCC
ncbi:response regulator transcription factor [Lysobacter xanthus]